MKYSTTREKEQVFIVEANKILRSKLRMSKSVAEKEINWFILQWGLTTNEAEAETMQSDSGAKQQTRSKTKK